MPAFLRFFFVCPCHIFFMYSVEIFLHKAGGKMTDNILIIGLMGVGKTTVARGIAKELDMDFFDTDTELEEVTGLKLKDIYRKYGEIRFRSEEALVMNKLRKKQNCVISVGTSLAMTEATKELLPQIGSVVWLDGSSDSVKERLKRKYNKVLLPKGVNLKNFDDFAAELMKDFAETADYTVNVDGLDLDGVVRKIVAAAPSIRST